MWPLFRILLGYLKNTQYPPSIPDGIESKLSISILDLGFTSAKEVREYSIEKQIIIDNFKVFISNFL